MSQFDYLKNVVRDVARRRRLLRAWGGLWQGLLLGASLWLVGTLIYKLFPVPLEISQWTGIVSVACVVATTLARGWKKEPAMKAAAWLDASLNLKERVSTALELGSQREASPWRDLVVLDASNQLKAKPAGHLLPFSLPHCSRYVLLLLTLAFAVGFAPEYRSKAHQQKEKGKEQVREVGKGLVEVVRKIPERKSPSLEKAQEALKAVGDLGAQLSRQPPAVQEALKELAKVGDRIRQEAKNLAQNPALRNLEKMARSSAPGQTTSPEQLQQQMEALQKQLGEKSPAPEALQKLEQALQKAREAAAQMFAQGPAATPEQKQALSEALSNLSKQAQGLNVPLDGLEQAMESFQTAKIDQVLKNLEASDQDLSKMMELTKALQKMQQQAQAMGKTLSEQLERGQTAPAAETLRKMAKQLTSGTPSAEQLKKMEQELEKAIGPAKDYGKVSDQLQKALRELRQGQKTESGSSMQQAAKELDELQEQMAGMEDLQSALQALGKAQAGLGNGSGWSMAQRPGGSGKQGGKPGKGVGTWADESLWMEPPTEAEMWDNSGVQRQDAEAKGLADRGEGKLPEGIVPTRLKGQMSPGGQMPSVTLRGVSLKGQSTVVIQEAVSAAQTEAESALSQDQVPRAYQNAVKEYFDDLKK